jgi:eukaryotic-like serine/threonine-protein kinase
MHAGTPEPKRIAQYEVFETLASAGKVRCYRAVDSSLQRTVTLKTIIKDPRDSHAAATIARFQNQARTSSSFDHPGIVNVYEYGEDGALAFVVSEYVEGCALRERMRVPIKDSGSIVVQLLEALEYAHEQGVVHGNLKPSNLLLTSKGQLRITDFACADSKSAPGPYMSPEQLNGARLTGRSDIFSAGAIFYELLTGQNAFPGAQETLAQRVCRDREQPPSQVNGNVPAGFDSVCAKALAKKEEQRYLTAGAFAEDIRIAFENAYGLVPRDLVSNETVVSIFLSSLRGRSRTRSESKASPPKVEPPKPPAPPDAAWDAPVLRMVERQLAAFIGPLARVIVREAASKTKDLDALYSLAAESLEKDDDRRLFLSGQKMINPGAMRNEAPRSPKITTSPDAETATLGPELLMRAEHAAPANPSPAPPVPDKRERNINPAPIENVARASEARPASLEKLQFTDTGPKELKGFEFESHREPPPQITPAANREANSTDRPHPIPQSKSEPQQVKPEEDADIVARLEEVLGKQPENLVGYLRENPPQAEEVIHALVASVEALAAMYAEKGKLEAIVPQSICFDRLGKVTIQGSQTALTQSTSASGVGSPRYAAPEIFAEKGAADPTGAAANVYALGFMFYEILLGTKLFRKTFAVQRNELDWLRWHADVKSKAPALKSLLPDRPAALSDLLESMIEKDVAARTTDLQTILSRVRTIAQQANRTIVVKKPGISRKPPTKTSAATSGSFSRGLLIFTIVLLILAAAALFVWRNPRLHDKLLSPFKRPAQTTDQPESR